MIALVFVSPRQNGEGLNRERGCAIRRRSDEVPAKLCNETARVCWYYESLTRSHSDITNVGSIRWRSEVGTEAHFTRRLCPPHSALRYFLEPEFLILVP